LYLGYAAGDNATAKQRQIYYQGADPFQVLYNPFLRSRGALLVGDDMHYHAPGGAGVRGIDSRASSSGVVALNLELDQSLLTRASARLFQRVAVAAFGDLAVGDNVDPSDPGGARFVGDVGIGLRADHRIGDTRFTTRFDLPLYVNRPELSVGPRDDEIDFRWVFSFEPAF
jgi:hypothetical protein